MTKIIPCSDTHTPATSTVTWISGDYSQSCYIVKHREIGGIPCAYIGHLFDNGEVNVKRGVSIVFLSQLFVSAAELAFMRAGPIY